MRIGILGGTFNPIHNTHLEIARSAREQLQLERVIFIPARTPPHKQADATIVAAHHRVRMVELATTDFDAFEVSDIEIRREGPSYTVDTVAELKEQLGPEAEIFFLMGADQVLELPAWHRVEELVKLCRLVPVERPGYPLEDIEGLAGWQQVFGPGHTAVFVFAYKIKKIDVDFDGRDVYDFAQNRYIFFCVKLDDYREFMKRRSPKWQTVTLPADKFRQCTVQMQKLLF